ncbi:hypothetical protein EJB05_00590, partial [Eragrostis curvula]
MAQGAEAAARGSWVRVDVGGDRLRHRRRGALLLWRRRLLLARTSGEGGVARADQRRGRKSRQQPERTDSTRPRLLTWTTQQGYALGSDMFMKAEFLHFRCAAHVLNIMVQQGVKIISRAISRVRDIVKVVTSTPSRLQIFNSIAEKCELRTKSGMIIDVPHRWNATYDMLHEALEYKVALDRFAVEQYQAAPSDVDWQKAEAPFRLVEKNSDAYPVLSLMARDFLAIPVSTVSSESAFSMAGRIIGKERTSLAAGTLEALICSKDWFIGFTQEDEGQPMEGRRFFDQEDEEDLCTCSITYLYKENA